MSDNPATIGEAIARLDLEGLSWLADAPLFIDREQVEAFYDAIARPETKSGSVQTTRTVVNDLQAKLGAGAEATAKFPKLLRLFPFLDAEAKLSLSGEADAQHTDQSVKHSEYLPIDTPQRQLVRLALHYFTKWEDRTVLVSKDAYPGEGWWGPSFSAVTPRALVFIDFPAHTLFIPAAAEVASGQVVLIFPRLQEAYARPGETLPPPYPGSEANVSETEDAERQTAYWQWFTERMREKPNKATKAVEDTIAQGGGRVEWIDYRVPLRLGLKPLHLHVCGRGAYDTGTFAYNLVQRGYRHGLRVVGTLKSEPDLNVLAIFEK
jgi:hypothetical protein